jgi:hypothetical protein
MRKLALDGPQSVTSLGGLMDRAQDSMSRHLTVLWQTGAVVGIEPPDGDTHKQFYAARFRAGRKLTMACACCAFREGRSGRGRQNCFASATGFVTLCRCE